MERALLAEARRPASQPQGSDSADAGAAMASCYRPLPGAAPDGGAGAGASRRSPVEAQKGGKIAAHRRLRASRAGRISTVNYRPLPPCPIAGRTVDAADGRDRPRGPHRVRFGDVLSLHCSVGQLTVLDAAAAAAAPEQQRAGGPSAARWKFSPEAEQGNAAAAGAGGEFEVCTACEWAKQRKFSGAVRAILGHRSVMGAAHGAEIIQSVDSLPLGTVSPEARDALQRKLRFAEAESRANETGAAVGTLERAAVENGARVQLRHVASGRWLSCCSDALKKLASSTIGKVDSGSNSSSSVLMIAAKAALQLRSEGDESCWFAFHNTVGVGAGANCNIADLFLELSIENAEIMWNFLLQMMILYSFRWHAELRRAEWRVANCNIIPKIFWNFD